MTSSGNSVKEFSRYLTRCWIFCYTRHLLLHILCRKPHYFRLCATIPPSIRPKPTI